MGWGLSDERLPRPHIKSAALIFHLVFNLPFASLMQKDKSGCKIAN
jgi:hypothetical protein